MENFLIYSNIFLWILQIVILLILFLVLRQFGEVYLQSADAISRDGISIEEEPPEFRLPSYHTGNFITNDDFFHNKPTLIAFVSPNCKACKDLFNEWNEKFIVHRSNFNFLMVGLGQKEHFNQVLRNRTIMSEFLLDEKKEILVDFRVRVTPFAFIIDHKGVVKGKGLCNGNEHIERLISILQNDKILTN